MTATYRWVQWNAHKRIYDAVLALAIAGFIGAYIAVSLTFHAGQEALSPPILVMRALGATGVLLLHVILCIGPLARFSDKFAPLLYNRRHLGVGLFFITLLHAAIALGFYGGFGVRDPFSAVLAGYHGFDSVSSFPFEFVGFLALLIFFVMAATSHDFWLAQLGPKLWKTLHMLVYPAYGLVVVHIALGALQSETSPLLALLLLLGVIAVVGLHLAAGITQSRRDRARTVDIVEDGWLPAGQITDYDDACAKVVQPRRGESIAVFRQGNTFCAVVNQCAHQGGPLGEGRIIDGCITCPWHGYQFDPSNGRSPPPYSEQIATHAVRIRGQEVFVSDTPSPLSAPATPATLPSGALRD